PLLFVARRIAHGLKTAGPRYLLRVVPNEFARPRLAITRHLRAGLVAVHDLFRGDVAKQRLWSENCLQFYYDLAAGPITFDFAGYLAGAELERKRRGLSGIVVIFVPGRHDGARPELPAYEAVFDRESRAWRLRHMLVPMLAFLPTVRGH